MNENVDVAMTLKKYSCANCERWGKCYLSEVIPLAYISDTLCRYYKSFEYPYGFKEICELSQQTQCKFVSEYFEKTICVYTSDPPRRAYIYHVYRGKLFDDFNKLVQFDMDEISSKWRVI